MSSDLKLGQAGTGELARDDLTSRVRDALGDPTAQLLYWNPDEDGYLDAAGNAYETPGPEDHRALTELGHDGERVGAIVHDEWLGDEAETMRRISGVLTLAISNERLAAAVGRALDEVQASRERIARAGDQERRRIARDLHDGAQQRLLGLALKARLLARRPAQGTATELDRLGDELDQAANELRGFVHGILPPALERHGLAAALRDASASLPVPTSIVESGSLDARPDPDIEQTAYFIAAEAMTNVTKHAQASQVEVEIARSDDRLMVEVRDDGVGGAAWETARACGACRTGPKLCPDDCASKVFRVQERGYTSICRGPGSHRQELSAAVQAMLLSGLRCSRNLSRRGSGSSESISTAVPGQPLRR